MLQYALEDLEQGAVTDWVTICPLSVKQPYILYNHDSRQVEIRYG